MMWRATLSSLLAHKVRLTLTTLAIVVGVAFVTGTLIYTDTTRSTFDSVFGQVTGSVDFSVRGISQLDNAEGGDQFEVPRPGVPPDVADRAAAVDGVAAVERNVEGVIGLLGADGQPLGSGQGPPALGFNAPTVDDLSPTELRDGRYPTAADEVALDAATAAGNGYAVGDTVRIAVDGPSRSTRSSAPSASATVSTASPVRRSPCSTPTPRSSCSPTTAATPASTCSPPTARASTTSGTPWPLQPAPTTSS
ncbi:MAG TPA: ABC transporter permease [Euzebyales bacterium]|nr:ABC transporter permease [Euzebyales bacterium]